MRKKLVLVPAFILSILLLTTGCQAYGSDTPEEQTPEAQPPTVQGGGSVPDVITGLTVNEYDGLDISVNVLERMAILPGNVFQATVLVENNGDKTVSFVQGSGSFQTPEAIFLYSDTLQTIIPQDHLGIMTMDFVTQELKPGESLLYKLDVIAVKPNPDFDAYTFEMFDEGTYIGDMEWSVMQERFPGLVAVEPGSYSLKAYFLYRIADENEQFAAFEGPTGYAVAESIIGIS